MIALRGKLSAIYRQTRQRYTSPMDNVRHQDSDVKKEIKMQDLLKKRSKQKNSCCRSCKRPLCPNTATLPAKAAELHDYIV